MCNVKKEKSIKEEYIKLTEKDIENIINSLIFCLETVVWSKINKLKKV